MESETVEQEVLRRRGLTEEDIRRTREEVLAFVHQRDAEDLTRGTQRGTNLLDALRRTPLFPPRLLGTWPRREDQPVARPAGWEGSLYIDIFPVGTGAPEDLRFGRRRAFYVPEGVTLQSVHDRAMTEADIAMREIVEAMQDRQP